jgi:hypothetical protein
MLGKSKKARVYAPFYRNKNITKELNDWVLV